MNIPDYKIIFRGVLDALEDGARGRRELINAVASSLSSSADELVDCSVCGRYSVLRSQIGTVINDMESRRLIARDDGGIYKKVQDTAVAIRVENCEEEILSLVSSSPMTKNQIKSSLAKTFKISDTPTKKDDHLLFDYISHILKSLVENGIFDYNNGKYSISAEKTAYIKNRTELLSLRASFLTRIHSRGGEFFEYYFLNLLVRYLSKSSKAVNESYVTGGSADGGIDGVIKTVDSLGFRELIMVQMKNRNDYVTETDVRGFYGAVCAKQGSRGIFATVSDFHPSARDFLDSIDNCVGVNGEKIFSMAIETTYGIKLTGEQLAIDGEII